MELRLPGTKTPLPEVKIKSDGRNTDTIPDRHESRVHYELQGGGEEIQMEPVDPAPNLPEDAVAPIVPIVPITPENPAIHRSTRIPRPSTKYPTAEYDYHSGRSLEKL